MRAIEKSTYVSGTSSIFFAFSCYTQRVLGLSYFLRGQAIWAKILNTEDTIKLIKKLSISCDPGKPKRPLLDSRYPNLCLIFDQITIEDLEVNATFTTRHFFKKLKLTKDQNAQLMAYASDNLVKINAFIDSPYISKYQMDEVWDLWSQHQTICFFFPRWCQIQLS